LASDVVLSHVLSYFPNITEVAVSGFSDGASYALSLGLANPDVFSHVLAWSPGFIIPTPPPPVTSQLPKFFISHGVEDSVLGIERCSRRIVPQLRGRGAEVNYQEFSGRHEIPREMSIAGLKDWLE
jgi:predicted esterase